MIYIKLFVLLIPRPLRRIFGRVERSGTRNIRSSVVSGSKFGKNLRSEREEQDSRIIQDRRGRICRRKY